MRINSRNVRNLYNSRRLLSRMAPLVEPEVGQTVSAKRVFTQNDVDQFAQLSGDFNPLHCDKQFANKLKFNGPIVHGALINGTISSLIGTKLPGIGSILLEQDLHFPHPLYVGEEFEAIVKITSKKRSIYICEYQCHSVADQEKKVFFGQALVLYKPSKFVHTK